ncbi:MAG TPA: penicillin-binding protein 2 [Candidatus Saccharimonadales bacterium]
MPVIEKLSVRARLFALIFLAIGAVFVCRLFYLQVVAHADFVKLAAAEHDKKFDLPATRGLIYAKDGDHIVPLVLNEPVYTVYADPAEVKDAHRIANVIHRVAGGEMVTGFEERLQNKKRRYVVLAQQVNKRQADLIMKEKLSGVGTQAEQKRVYPEGSLAAQVLGYVNREGKGQYGLEGALDNRLAGKDGLRTAVVDARGIPLTVSSKDDVITPPKNGDDIVLSVDRNIQAYIEKALAEGLKNAKANHGSALVLDPNTGRVMAMATLPTYDPSQYYKMTDYGVFQNPVVSDPYEAGSGIKTLTMVAGLDSGAVTPASVFTNVGYDTVDGIRIKNAEPGKYLGRTDMTGVIEHSLNSGVIYILKQMGKGQVNYQARQQLYDYFTNRFGIGQLTGIEQTNEQAGKIFSPDDEQGNNVRYANMVFGQGFNITMLQSAMAFSAAINGGTMYKPTLIEGTMKPDGDIAPQAPAVKATSIISAQASAELRSMIQSARMRVYAKADKPGYIIGGKSGTSQTIDPKTGKYRDENAIATYTGFGGNGTPRYVVMVRIVDSQLPGFDGTIAAQPIFANISNWLLDYLRIPKVQ